MAFRFLHLFCPLVAFLSPEAMASPTLVDRAVPDRVQKRAATCTPSSGGTASVDDTPAIAAAFKNCGNGGVIVFPQDVTYMIRSQLDFSGCVGCEVRLDGRLKASDDLTYWNNTRYMVRVKGINGAKIHSPLGTGLVDGNGQAAWDRFGASKDLRRPTLLTVESSTDIEISDISLKNAQNVFISVGSKSARVGFSNMNITAISKSTYPPKNTDGFDIGESENVSLSNIYIQNDDDCVAFKAGCNYATVIDITCRGSHGLSVGSLGKYPGSVDSVTNVYVKNAIMRDSTKAAGIKIYPGGSDHGTAVVRNVTWDGIQVDNCDAAFEFDTCYNSDEDYCQKNPSPAQVTEIYINNFSGKTSTHYAPTTGHIFCPTEGDNCQFKGQKWTVESSKGQGQLLCHNISPDVLGISCVESNP